MAEEVLEEEVKTPEIEEEVKEEVKIPEEEPAEEKEGEKEEEVADSEPKKKKTLEDRQKELRTRTWEMREAERQANEARAAAEEATAKLEAAQKTSGNERPKEDNFDTQEEYIEALTTYKADQAILKYDAGRKKEDAAAFQKRQGEESLKDWNFRREKAISQHKDFVENEDLVQKVLTHYGNQTMAQTIIDSEKGISIVQHLGKNTDELERIAQMSPISAIKEIGKLEIRFEKKPVKKVSSAPAPVKPVGGGGSASSGDYKTMSTVDFMKKRNEEAFRGKRK